MKLDSEKLDSICVEHICGMIDEAICGYVKQAGMDVGAGLEKDNHRIYMILSELVHRINKQLDVAASTNPGIKSFLKHKEFNERLEDLLDNLPKEK